MTRLKISAISYLNTAPLMWDFDHGELRRKFEIHYTVPSACAEELRAGTADIGIIPTIAYQTIPELAVIPDVGIAAKAAVRSIVLVSKKPLGGIKTVAADSSSRTSVALLQILFRKGWLTAGPAAGEGAPSLPRFLPHQPKLKKMLRACDAALLIGDPALLVDRTKYHVWDLAEEWNHFTGKPFVFAFWAVRKAALDSYPEREQLAGQFQKSRDHGLGHVDDLAREWSPRAGIPEAQVKSYLTKNINYYLDADNVSGLNLFFQLAHEYGMTESNRPITFIGEKSGTGAGSKRPDFNQPDFNKKAARR
jgi:chorismate dehydratase